MKQGGIKFNKDNIQQMDVGKSVIKDVVKQKIKNPETVIIKELERAIKYHNKDNAVALPNLDSLTEYITTIIRIHDNNGKWTIDKKRKSAKMDIVCDVYQSVFGEQLEIDSSEQIAGQISVEDVCPLEADPTCDVELDDLPFCDGSDDFFPEPFDVWQSDIYMFLTGWCRSFSLEDGVYTLKIDKELLERRFRKEA